MAEELPPLVPEPDSTHHADLWYDGVYGDKNDVVYVPGEGVYFSAAKIRSLQNEAAKMASTVYSDTIKYGPLDKRYQQFFLSEDMVNALSAHINTRRKMQGVKDSYAQERHEYEQQCYPGTDTEDPTKAETRHDKQRNNFQLDRSRSTILLSVASGERYLNGSIVPHSHYVRLSITCPDGREIVELALTFDQFASFLVSSMHTPCTVDTYWSVNDQCVRLREVVKKPEDIHTRMEQRLQNRLTEIDERLAAIRQDLNKQIATGKAMSKTKLEQLEQQLRIFEEHLHSNRDFTVHQAREEVSSIVEQAACTIALEHQMALPDLLNSPVVKAMLSLKDKE